MEVIKPPIRDINVRVHNIWGHQILVWTTQKFELCDRLEEEAGRYTNPADGSRFSLWALDPEEFPATSELKALFSEGIDYWLLATGYQRGEGRPEMTTSWVECYTQGAYIPPHNHASHLSVLFFSRDLSPAPVTQNVSNEAAAMNGATYLIDPGAPQHARALGNGVTCQIFSQKGRMVIFPSSLVHGTHPIIPGEFKRTFVTDVRFRSMPSHNSNTIDPHEPIHARD